MWQGIDYSELIMLDPNAPIGAHVHFARIPSYYSFDFYMTNNASGSDLLGKRIVEFSNARDFQIGGYAAGGLNTHCAIVPPYTQAIPPRANFWVAVRGNMPVATIGFPLVAAACPADPTPPAAP